MKEIYCFMLSFRPSKVVSILFDRIESLLIIMAHQVLSDDYCSLEKCLKNDLPFSASVRMGLRLSTV